MSKTMIYAAMIAGASVVGAAGAANAVHYTAGPTVDRAPAAAEGVETAHLLSYCHTHRRGPHAGERHCSIWDTIFGGVHPEHGHTGTIQRPPQFQAPRHQPPRRRVLSR